MINDVGKPIQEKISEMVEANLKVSQQILDSTLKIKKYILWMKIMNILKLLVIIIPILLGLLYLSPYLKSMQSAFGVYGELLGIESPKDSSSVGAGDQTPQDILQQIEELKKDGSLDKLLN